MPGLGVDVFRPRQTRGNVVKGGGGDSLQGVETNPPLELGANRDWAVIAGINRAELALRHCLRQVRWDGAGVGEHQVVEVATEAALGVSESYIGIEVHLTNRDRRVGCRVEGVAAERDEAIAEAD